jgi:hypothetical protein
MVYRKFSDTLKSVSTCAHATVDGGGEPTLKAADGSDAPTSASSAALAGVHVQIRNLLPEPEAPATPAEAWRRGIARLNPARNLCHPTVDGWERFICDCERFLDSDWCEKAAALGWDERALFGAHPVRPNALPWWGTLHHLHGGKITAISAGLMMLKTRRGVPQTLRRHHHPADMQVPVWMLLNCQRN